MSLPLLDYPLSTQNNRVATFTTLPEGPNQILSQTTRSRDLLIEKAYRQIYFHAMKSDRDTCRWNHDARLCQTTPAVRTFQAELLPMQFKLQDGGSGHRARPRAFCP